MTDWKLAWRRLCAAPVFTTFAIVTLACGIGVTTAMYSAIYAIGGRPLGVGGSDRVLLLTRSAAMDRTRPILILDADFQELRARAPLLSGSAAWAMVDGVLAGPTQSERVSAEAVTGAYFDVVSVPMTLGRPLVAGDDTPAAAPVLVLSHLSWRRHFSGDPRAIGSKVRFAGQDFDVVGVAPRNFRGVGQRLVGGIAAWVPLSKTTDPRERPLQVVARLAPDAAISDATAAVADAGAAIDTVRPRRSTGPGLAVLPRAWAWTPLDEANDFGLSEIMQVVMILPLLVLLVACTNLANLVLSRSAARRHEYAVRGALGATRWQMLREALTESAVVVGAGGALGVVVAHALLTGAVRMLREPMQALTASPPLDWQLDPVLLAGAGASAVASFLVAGLVPALRMTRVDVGRSLTTGDAVQSLPKWRGRSNLIALQVGISAAMFLITVIAVRFVIVDPPRVVTRDPAVVGLTIAELRVDSPAAIGAPASTMAAIVEETRQQPGVALAAGATSLPFGLIRGSKLDVETSKPGDPAGKMPRLQRGTALMGATPDLFRTLGIALLAGREFTDTDRDVVIVDEDVAARVFKETNVVGRDIVLTSRWIAGQPPVPRVATIVGVAPPAAPAPAGRRGDMFVYVPMADYSSREMIIIARPAAGDSSLVDSVRAAIRAVDRDLAIGAAGRGRVMAERGFGVVRLLVSALGILATLTLVLASAGLYGVMSDVVTRRTREMGIRVALGAGTRRIVMMVMRQGVRPVAEGAFIGVASALVIRQMMQANLTRTLSSLDVGTAIVAIAPLVVAGLAAVYFPARRAARVNPNVALRRL